MNTNPIEDLLGAGRVVLGMGKTYKADMAANHDIDPTKTMTELNAAMTVMEDANTDQNAKETAYHESVLATTTAKDKVTKKASCLCDLVIGAYGRGTPRGQEAMNARASLYSGTTGARETTAETPSNSAPTGANGTPASNGADRNITPVSNGQTPATAP